MALLAEAASLVWVPGGEFQMGDEAGLPDQQPVHRVRVGGLWVARFPVQRWEYQVFCDETGTAPPPSWKSPLFRLARQPAVGVTWPDAMAYCHWIASVTGRAFRLPTEAEREHATRGPGSSTRYPWGSHPTPEGPPIHALGAPPPVDEGFPNELGIRGLADGVHEWCLDWYDPTYYARSPVDDPRGPPAGTRRVSRGGSWRHRVTTTPSAARSSLPPHMSYTDYGFRVVEEAAGPALEVVVSGP